MWETGSEGITIFHLGSLHKTWIFLFFFNLCNDIMGTLLFLPHHFLYQTHSKINKCYF